MSLSFETAQRAAEYARAEVKREQQIAFDLAAKRQAAFDALSAAREASPNDDSIPLLKLRLRTLMRACATQRSLIAAKKRNLR